MADQDFVGLVARCIGSLSVEGQSTGVVDGQLFLVGSTLDVETCVVFGTA